MAWLGARSPVRRFFADAGRDVVREVEEVLARRQGGRVSTRGAVAFGLGLAAWGNTLVATSRLAGKHGDLVTLAGQAVAVPLVVRACMRRGFDARSLGLTLAPIRQGFKGHARFMLVLSGAAVAAGLGVLLFNYDRCSVDPAVPIARLLVATSLGEEVLFRGALFAVWAATGRGAGVVTVANAGFFALWHVAGSVQGGRFDPWGVGFPAVSALLFFVWARARFGSVVAPAVVHASGNLPAWVLTKCR